MADIELVIKIDENIYRRLKSGNYGLLVSNTCAYEVLNGIPLEKHDEEVIKETVASIWGKPPYMEVLDSIRSEIEEHRNKTEYMDKYDLIGDCLDIIDKYRKADKE